MLLACRTAGTWSEEVAGLDKQVLLRQILPMCAATRGVPGLVGEFQGLLADVDSGRARLSTALGKRRHASNTLE